MKSIFFKATLLSALALSTIMMANAQEKKAATKPVSQGRTFNVRPLNAKELKSRFPVPVQNLWHFLGKWKADAAIVSGGKTHHVDYEVIGRGTADGAGVYIEESFKDSVLGNMRGGNLVGYDPNDSKIHWYSVDNQNPAHEHTGNWAGSDSLILNHKGVRNGKTYTEKIHFYFKGRDTMEFDEVATLDGKETLKASGTFNRVMPNMKDKPAPVSGTEKK